MATDEQRALWSAILTNPHDDAPRLVYADWLQERGDEPRAEFIRVQIELENLGLDRRKGRKRRPVLEAREKELLAAHRKEWLAPFLGAVAGVTRGPVPEAWLRLWAAGAPFRRGFPFVDWFDLERARLLGEAGRSVEPVEVARVVAHCDDYRHPSLDAFARWIGSNGVVQLQVDGATNASIDSIIAPGHFRSLTHLELTSGLITEDGAEQLARWPRARGLFVLDLRSNPITDTGAFALADSPHLDNLAVIDLRFTRITDVGRCRLRERFGHRVQSDGEVI